ncbi:MAG: hypothetical protein A3D21_06690 [Nitrospirae bacterium RIFCSPHIGHO2_02_FULL_42_12]|nr:MAG: hypothetical protein A3D21_06690 [Nitrospirae bacterium RIFCSPHIGHO2_02_FULL_42_12]
MAVIRSKSEADYTFKAGSYSGNKLRVVSFFGSEGISEMFRYNIDLASLDGEVDFDEVIGQPALLTIHGLKGKRYVHGIVSLFEQTGKEGKWTRYRAEVVPAIWILSRHYTCRIFQTQTIPDIIKKVLTDAGISSDQFRFSLKKTYKPRDYCVQYRESDLSFISRLMEQYGIFYLFEHAEDKDIMVIGNDPVVHVPIQDPATVIYHAPGTTGVSDQEHIFEYRFNREIRSGAVMLKDFDFKKPRLNLGAEEKINGDGKLEVYDYPGEYEAPDLGKDLAKVRLEEIQSTQKVGSGQSDCRRFIPGYRFTLDKFSRTELNREYLLIQLTHSGNQPQSLGAEGGGSSSDVMYENRFTCIPSDVSFRPLRLTPRPMIAGPQTAVVVGPKGEEIYTDEYGRVKVQFHWDRDGKQDEKSSCWIRAAQIWAGTGWGAMFIPRIGQEVIVEFLEGDPDQPIITGRVYNGDNMPPYTLPAEKTKSTMKSNSSKGGGGSNEFRFEDAKDSEEIYLHGQKDWTIVIENDKNQKVGKDETLEVGENRDKKVGKDQSEDIGDNKTITVGKNHTEKIGENANIDIGKDETISIGKNQSISINDNMTLTVGKNLTESISDNADYSIGKDCIFNIGKNLTMKIGEKGTVEVNKDLGVNVGKKLNIQAADQINILSDKEIVLKTGSASISMKKNGDIVINGKKISIKASSDLVMKGSKISGN